MILERMSKLTVVASACAAVLVGAWLGAREWALIWPLSLGLFAAGIIVGRVWGAGAWMLPLVCAYVVPVIFLIVRGGMAPAYWMPWLAALLGGVLGNMDFRQWNFPAQWKWPLTYWALAVGLVWPAVIAREADFSWPLISTYNVANSGLGGPPPVVAVWVLYVALTHLVGLLWTDTFFTKFALADRERSLSAFTRLVVWPLGVSVVVSSALAIYQGTVDVAWLSAHQWPGYNRAAAGLLDGDGYGALAGFWVGAFFALAALSRSPALRVVALAGAGACAAGLWMTGSRMALLAGLISVAAGLCAAAIAKRWSLRQIALGAIAAIVIASALGALVARSSTASPVTRVIESLPEMSADGISKFAVFELWNRFGPFGTASMDMVRQFPLSGIGVGSFNHLFTDYAFVLVTDRAHMDNAQSWYRHQLAELGVLGSLGWLIWLPMFAWLLARTRGNGDDRFPAGVVKGVLLGVGIVSLVSMPTQVLPVSLTVWVFIFWYVLLSADAAERLRVSTPWPAVRWRMWPLWIAAFVFVGATVVAGWRDLRPPYRALRADWTYQVGFSDLETGPDGSAIRWTETHAVMVLPVTGEWLKLTVRGGPPDLAANPVTLVIRRLGKKIVSVTRISDAPETWYVKAPTGQKRMMLEFDVSRRGVGVDDWTFVAAPPRGAVEIR